MLRRNVGGLDRFLRVTIGAILFVAGLVLLTGQAGLGVTLAVVGVLGLATGIAGFCALYIPFGASTAKPEPPHVRDCWRRREASDRGDSRRPAPVSS